MSDSSETIQEIAFKLMLEQNKNDKILNGTTERTIFVLGSKGVVLSANEKFKNIVSAFMLFF